MPKSIFSGACEAPRVPSPFENHAHPTKTATATFAVAHSKLHPAAKSQKLSSPIASLAALLAGAGISAAALFTSAALRLLGLSTLAGFASHLSAHMIAILDHVWAAQLICFVSILVHIELLSPRPWSTFARECKRDRLQTLSTRGQARSEIICHTRYHRWRNQKNTLAKNGRRSLVFPACPPVSNRYSRCEGQFTVSRCIHLLLKT